MPSRRSSLITLVCFTALCVIIPADVPGVRAGGEEHAKLDDRLWFIVDTDMGLDDVRAIFALLAADKIEIGAMVTVEGSASIGRGTDNLIGMLELTHHDDIPVCRGYAHEGSPAPPWRKTANNLCGVTFPPPRSIASHTDTPAWLKASLEGHTGVIIYLALGPLGNLSRLADRFPGTLGMIDQIWIPAELTPDGAIDSWNLSYEAAAARVVIDAAREIVILDMAPACYVDTEEFLSSIEGTTHAAGWIVRFMSRRTDCGAHLFVYDELLAAAVTEEDIATLRSERYRIEIEASKKLVLKPDDEGNVRIAYISDTGAALDRLRTLWETADEQRHRHAAHDRQPPQDLLKSFHGHLGPYVVLGYRIGALALELLESKGHFGITAEVHSILHTPQSCLIDGIQLGSGCTLGKRNIEIYEHDGPAYAVFEVENGMKIRIALRSTVPRQVSSMIEAHGVEAVGEYFLTAPADSLFEIGETHRE